MKTKNATRTRSDPPRRTSRRSSASRRRLPPVEVYSDERIAEFLLNNAVDSRDYALACKDVRKLGLNPAKIRHIKPPDAE